jgi:alginate O-acetyltransferase complex protein AlgI
MLFNSLSFALFLPIVFLCYWAIASKKLIYQNILLLAASYFFYACWDYRFLFLLIFSTVLDFFTGLKMEKAKTLNEKKIWFWISVIINVGFLAVFKYYNFFADSFATALGLLGFKANYFILKVILPIGISFYTFHGLSYVIDIYKNKIKAEKNFIDYSLFVSFFPLLVAGPIERATHLLPQIKKERTFNYLKAVDGLRQILWGLFKKVVIADTCATYANMIFDNASTYNGSTLILGALFFAFQIYCDFSGYSDIALGTARLFGIELLKNFSFPYFSRDIAEFWRRWHISLSSWFRDYLYIPLGGSKGGKWMRIKNTFIIFLVSGFWHGANWTFIVWGAIHACYFLPLLLLDKNRDNVDIVAKGRVLPSVREFLNMLLTFTLSTFAWIFFRARNLQDAFIYIRTIFSKTMFTLPQERPFFLIILIIFLVIIEWVGRESNFALEKSFLHWPSFLRLSFYAILAFSIFIFAGKEQAFIYFQF